MKTELLNWKWFETSKEAEDYALTLHKNGSFRLIHTGMGNDLPLNLIEPRDGEHLVRVAKGGGFEVLSRGGKFKGCY